MNGMQTRSSDENSVCPSVNRVHCDKTEERSVRYLYHTFIVFEKKNGWWGRDLLREIFGKLAPVGAKSPIFNRYSLVVPQP